MFSTLNYLATKGRFFIDWTQKLLFTVNPEFSSQSKCHIHNSSVVDSEPNSISTMVKSSSALLYRHVVSVRHSSAISECRISLIIWLDHKFLQIPSSLELKYFPVFLLPSSEHACQVHSST